MTHLRKMMLEELERRNYSKGTIRNYLRFVERFAKHFGKSPDKLGPEHLRNYQAYLLLASPVGRLNSSQAASNPHTSTTLAA